MDKNLQNREHNQTEENFKIVIKSDKKSKKINVNKIKKIN